MSYPSNAIYLAIVVNSTFVAPTCMSLGENGLY